MDWTFKTNVYAMFWITQAALEHMQRGSVIINTTPEQGYDPAPWLLDYAPTKAAINTFSKALAKQLVDRGIRVNAVAPGPFWTPLQVSVTRAQGNGLLVRWEKRAAVPFCARSAAIAALRSMSDVASCPSPALSCALVRCHRAFSIKATPG